MSFAECAVLVAHFPNDARHGHKHSRAHADALSVFADVSHRSHLLSVGLA
jgi:hypothetical protein